MQIIYILKNFVMNCLSYIKSKYMNSDKPNLF